MIEEEADDETLWHELKTAYDRIVPSGRFTSAPNIDTYSNDKEKEKETKRHYDGQWPTTETPITTIERRT